MQYLSLHVTYDVDTDNFSVDGDVKDDKRVELLMAYIRSQIGEGADHSPRTEARVYKISLQWYPDGDRFVVSHNCGNKGLREGLLIEAARRLRDGAIS